MYTQSMTRSPTLQDIFRRAHSFAISSLPNRPWDWPAAALTVALVQISSTRLVITEWVPALDITQAISLYAVILGLALGYSSFTRRSAIWAAVEYGLLLIPLNLLLATEPSDNYYEDMRELFLRLNNSLSLFLQNQPVYDTLFFVLLTSISFWIVGAYAGYHWTRHKDYMDVVLAPGLIMLLVQIYDPWVPLRAWGLATYIFVALALLGRMHFLENRASWKKKHVFISSDTEWEFSRSVLSTAAIAVVVAWALPGVLTSVEPAAEAWRDFTKPIIERLSDAVSALDSPYGTSAGGDFYGTDLRLGSTAPVSDTPVFYVEVEDPDFRTLRFYWRGRVYDEYAAGQWTNTSTLHRSFDPEEDEIPLIDPFNRAESVFTFTMNFPRQELLYGPPEMIWVSREGRMIVNTRPGNIGEVTAWFTDSSLAAGDNYKVRALLADPTIQVLRAAGTGYPEWVTQTYLQVPQELQSPLEELAMRITAPYLTPYDKVQAITSYLRNEIEYEAKITESHPQGVDPLLWVLFDHKKGFCMYYASAEVLLLRTIGIPARMAVGFAQGEYDSQLNRFTVQRLNSHAWPEVYFPGTGWVEFEPTANQEPLDRPQADVEPGSEINAGATPQNGPLEDQGPDNLPGFDPTLNEVEGPPVVTPVNPWLRYLYPGLLLLLISSAIVLIRAFSLTERLPVYLVERYARSGSHPPRWLSHWANWSRLRPIERAFHSIDVSLHQLGQAQPSFTTPAQRAHILAISLPSAAKAINDLAREHENALFTSRPANLPLARRASAKLIFETWRLRIFRYSEYLKRRYN